MKTIIRAIIIASVLAGAAGASDMSTLSYDEAILGGRGVSKAYRMPGTTPLAVGSDLILGGQPLLVQLFEGEGVGDVDYEVTCGSIIGHVNSDRLFSETPTSDDNRYDHIAQSAPDYGKLGTEAVRVVGEANIDGRRYARLLVLPVTVDDIGELRFNSEICVNVGSRQVVKQQMISEEALRVAGKPGINNSALATGPEYVIVTNLSLASSFDEFARYKNETGYETEIKLIEDITVQYGGIDDAERLREYLKDFYAQGGQYVLLGGNESVVPVRYAYHYRTSVQLDWPELQICDMYYGDMNGDWDTDGDGVWGEKYDDLADLETELLVGRLPFDSPQEIANYTEKLIAYETNPGNGDRSYLNRAFFFSSDQMRDYSQGGQHGRIATSYPGYFDIDTTNGVEMARGDSPSPTNAGATELHELLSSGYGIVNLIAHGRGDGFTVKSSGYSEWPKQYYLTSSEQSGHGCLDSIPATGKPAFFYSLSCDNGGFDLENLTGASDPGLARNILARANGGAIGFVAHSRWGWVGSSYLLQQAFFASLFDNPSMPATEALNEAKAQYYFYRDLVMGLNFFGDPSLRVYTDIPGEMDLALTNTTSEPSVTVTGESGVLADCRVILNADGETFGEYVTDQSGSVTLPGSLEEGQVYTIVAVKEGYSVSREQFIGSIVTDVEDEDDLLPGSFALSQNYPNPFNPSTTIEFELAHGSEVTLTVYNILGQRVSTLVNETLPAGEHSVEWDGRDEGGSDVASGVYFYRVNAGDFSDVRKMVLVR